MKPNQNDQPRLEIASEQAGSPSTTRALEEGPAIKEDHGPSRPEAVATDGSVRDSRLDGEDLDMRPEKAVSLTKEYPELDGRKRRKPESPSADTVSSAPVASMADSFVL